MSDWASLESAPKDGRDVEVLNSQTGETRMAHYMDRAPEDHPPIDPGWYTWDARLGMYRELFRAPLWVGQEGATRWRPEAPPAVAR